MHVHCEYSFCAIVRAGTPHFEYRVNPTAGTDIGILSVVSSTLILPNGCMMSSTLIFADGNLSDGLERFRGVVIRQNVWSSDAEGTDGRVVAKGARAAVRQRITTKSGRISHFSLFFESRNSKKCRVTTSMLNCELLRCNSHFSPTCGATTRGK